MRKLGDCKSGGDIDSSYNIICESCVVQILSLWSAYQAGRLPATETAKILTPERLAGLRRTYVAEMADLETETLRAMGSHDPPSLDSHLLRLWTGILRNGEEEHDRRGGGSLLSAKLMFAMRGQAYSLYDLVDGPTLKEWLQAMEQLLERRAQRQRQQKLEGLGHGSSKHSGSCSRKKWPHCCCRYEDMGPATARGFWAFVKPRLHTAIGNAIESHYFVNNNAHPVCAADVYITMEYPPLQADLARLATTYLVELAGRQRLSREMRVVAEAFRGLGRGGGSRGIKVTDDSVQQRQQE